MQGIAEKTQPNRTRKERKNQDRRQAGRRRMEDDGQSLSLCKEKVAGQLFNVLGSVSNVLQTFGVFLPARRLVV